MPILTKLPKDTIELHANDLDDYMRTMKNWQNWGWLISSDYDAGLYSAIALKDSRVLLLLFKDDNFPKSESVEEPKEAETVEEALQQLHSEEKGPDAPPGPAGPTGDPDAAA